MNPTEICPNAEDQNHCFHTGSNMDTATNGAISAMITTHYMCCFCGQTKTETIQSSPIPQKPHGNHYWINLNQPISPFFTLPFTDWLPQPKKTYEPLPLFYDTNTAPTIIINAAPEVCMIDEFFKAEQQKPAHMRQTACFISCPCSKHRVMM